MNPLLVTLGILTFLSLSTQLFRHVHVAYVVPRLSVLNKYDEKTEKDIAASQSIEVLLRQYEEARQRIKQLEDDKTEEEKVKLPRVGEPYTSEHKLKEAIQAWESRSREIGELHFFWWCGFLCLFLGLACFLRSNRWLAVAALTAGFIEMIYWTSPTFRVLGGGDEFERLLTWKLVYTSISLAFLLGIWAWMARRAALVDH
jgi:Flp pilus assembly protein TadB